MALLVGAFLALAIGLFASAVGLDRDRAFYPTVTLVVASYYVLFAVMGASTHTLVLESFVAACFFAFAAFGFKFSLWIVVIALAGHGILDLAHGGILSNPGVPSWWRGFCLTYDITAAGYLAWMLKRRRIRAVA